MSEIRYPAPPDSGRSGGPWAPVLGGLGVIAALAACCLLPVALGAGAVSMGMDIFVVGAVVAAIVLVLAAGRRKRGCGCTTSCDRSQCQGKEKADVR